MRVLSLIHPELKNVENTKESMAEYADMIVDAITQFQTTYHGKEYTAEIDGIFGPASARAIKSKRDL
jgi:hypothetical protein